MRGGCHIRRRQFVRYAAGARSALSLRGTKDLCWVLLRRLSNYIVRLKLLEYFACSCFCLSYLGAHGLVSIKTNGSSFNKEPDQHARTPVELTFFGWWLQRCPRLA